MSITKNALVNVIGAFAPLVVTLVTVPVYIRVIGEERYGILAIIWVVLTYFYFFDIGLGKATAQRIAKLQATDNEAAKILWTSIILTFLLGVVGGGVLWGVADLILREYVDSQPVYRAEALAALPLLVVTLPIVLISSALAGALLARERFVDVNFAKVAGVTLSQALPLIVALYEFVDIASLVLATLAGSLLTFFLYVGYAIRAMLLRGTPCMDRAHVRPLLSYGSGALAISVVGPVLVTFDRLLIGMILGAKAVTYYTVPYSLTHRFLILSGSMASAIFPRLASDAECEASRLAQTATDRLVAIMAPLSIAGILLLHPFFQLWINVEFANEAKGVGEILLLGVCINSLVTAHFTNMQVAGKFRVILQVYLAEIPLYLVLLLLAISNFGVVGAAMVWTLRTTVDAIIFLAIAKTLRHTIRASILPIAMVVAAFVVSWQFDVGDIVYWILFVIILSISISLGWKHNRHTLNGLLPRKRASI